MAPDLDWWAQSDDLASQRAQRIMKDRVPHKLRNWNSSCRPWHKFSFSETSRQGMPQLYEHVQMLPMCRYKRCTCINISRRTLNFPSGLLKFTSTCSHWWLEGAVATYSRSIPDHTVKLHCEIHVLSTWNFSCIFYIAAYFLSCIFIYIPFMQLGGSIVHSWDPDPNKSLVCFLMPNAFQPIWKYTSTEKLLSCLVSFR